MFIHIQKLLRKAVENIEGVLDLATSSQFEEHRIKTGIAGFDETFAGIRNGRITLIAGSKMSGKTALALRMAFNIATKQRKKVVLLEAQSNNFVLFMRMLSLASGMNNRTVKNPQRWTGQDWSMFVKGLAWLNDSEIYFVEQNTPSIGEQIAEIKKLHALSAIELLIIDGLEIPEMCDNEVGASWEFRSHLDKFNQLAFESNMAVIVCIETDQSINRPTLRDLPIDAVDLAETVLITTCDEVDNFEKSFLDIDGYRFENDHEQPVHTQLKIDVTIDETSENAYLLPQLV